MKTCVVTEEHIRRIAEMGVKLCTSSDSPMNAVLDVVLKRAAWGYTTPPGEYYLKTMPVRKPGRLVPKP